MVYTLKHLIAWCYENTISYIDLIKNISFDYYNMRYIDNENIKLKFDLFILLNNQTIYMTGIMYLNDSGSKKIYLKQDNASLTEIDNNIRSNKTNIKEQMKLLTA